MENKKEHELENMLYTVKECSQILKCNVPFIHQLRKAGLIRFMKLGTYKCRKEELQRFLVEMEGKDVTDPLNIKALDDVEEQPQRERGENKNAESYVHIVCHYGGSSVAGMEIK